MRSTRGSAVIFLGLLASACGHASAPSPSVEQAPVAWPSSHSTIAARAETNDAPDSNSPASTPSDPPPPMPVLTPTQSALVDRAFSTSYVSSIRIENLRPIGAAADSFARYLNAMHRKIHPIFADRLVGMLDWLAVHRMIVDAPPRNPNAFTSLEILIDGSGSIANIGILQSSGTRDLDYGALTAVVASAPFDAPPHEILSPDGLLYLHWDFHRNATNGCATKYAHPFLLKAAPTH